MLGDISAAGLPAAPGGPSPAGSISETPQTPPAQKKRAAFYVDGFNLYHAIDDLAEPHLKWLNLWALAEALINRRQEEVVRVVWCTAEHRTSVEKQLRHRAYRKALEAHDVTVVSGHFVPETVTCRECARTYQKDVEKEGDVGVAIHLIGDAYSRDFDHFYLVSADSDQAATAKYFRAAFPDKKLITVAPPGRTHSKHILESTDGDRSIWKETLERCLFPALVTRDGRHVCDRPERYRPPAGWRRPGVATVTLPPRRSG